MLKCHLLIKFTFSFVQLKLISELKISDFHEFKFVVENFDQIASMFLSPSVLSPAVEKALLAKTDDAEIHTAILLTSG